MAYPGEPSQLRDGEAPPLPQKSQADPDRGRLEVGKWQINGFYRSFDPELVTPWVRLGEHLDLSRGRRLVVKSLRPLFIPIRPKRARSPPTLAGATRCPQARWARRASELDTRRGQMG